MIMEIKNVIASQIDSTPKKDNMGHRIKQMQEAYTNAFSILKDSELYFLNEKMVSKQFKKDEDKRKAQAAAILRKKAAESLHNSQQHRAGRGRGRGRGRGKGKDRGKNRRHNKRSRSCHRCGSKDHFVQNCPQPAPDSKKS